MSPRRNWDSPNPSLASECAPPPQNGDGAQLPAGEGLGESQFRRLEKKLSTLPILWRRLFENYTYPVPCWEGKMLGWEWNCVCA
jgi:hypothetical protein